MEKDFLHFDAGNVVTWGIILLTFAYNYGKSAQRFLENARKIAENTAHINGLESKMDVIQVNGSAGARHMFELLNAQISAHEVRITLHDSTVKDVVEIKAKVSMMMRMMQRRWNITKPEEGDD